MRKVPTSDNRADWPRLAADGINATQNAVSALQTATDWSLLDDYADDTAAAAGGVGVGQLYRTGSAIKVRVS